MKCISLNCWANNTNRIAFKSNPCVCCPRNRERDIAQAEERRWGCKATWLIVIFQIGSICFVYLVLRCTWFSLRVSEHEPIQHIWNFEEKKIERKMYAFQPDLKLNAIGHEVSVLLMQTGKSQLLLSMVILQNSNIFRLKYFPHCLFGRYSKALVCSVSKSNKNQMTFQKSIFDWN